MRRFIFTFLVSLLCSASNAESLPPLEEKELAGYMTQLQVITHKLSLSAHAGNEKLTRFYLHESLELLGDIQSEVPTYEDQAIALHIDRLALPAYKNLGETLKIPNLKKATLVQATQGIIEACNQCHAVTKHAYIYIRENLTNPYLQDFNP